MNKQVEKRIEQLREQIRDHDYKYFVLNEQAISDQEYDKLVKELEKLENENPDLITSDSPTQRVGKDITKQFNPVQHSEFFLPWEVFPLLACQNHIIPLHYMCLQG